MIVKNETHVIERCLASVKPLIDYWVIVDTGSTDRTQEIIKEFMKDIPGELHERPWVDFAHNRNEALNLAKGKADYLLFIDADDVFKIDANFKMPPLDKDFYLINTLYSTVTYLRNQLVKSNLEWKWIGPVHEVLVCFPWSYNAATLEGVNMVIMGGGDRSRDPKKFLKDAKVLEAALKKEPDHARWVFYLAYSYRDAGMLERAIQTFEKRVSMGGWYEEVFWSLYQIACIQENLQMPEEVVTKSYQRAFNYLPTRAEPLYRLSNYYRRKENYFLGYLMAKHGLEIKPPTQALLFIEYDTYNYQLLLEYSICAYWIGRYEESIKACVKLLSLELSPEVRECVQKNLNFALQKVPMSSMTVAKNGLKN
ncbi:MAG: glycosyltransferase [Verrucomicrobia bacterium]|nr:glycosyltransferase [Verrucomicrobiota bacterium]